MNIAKDIKAKSECRTECTRGARSLVWLGRRPHAAKVPGSSPGGPTCYVVFMVARKRFIKSCDLVYSTKGTLHEG